MFICYDVFIKELTKQPIWQSKTYKTIIFVLLSIMVVLLLVLFAAQYDPANLAGQMASKLNQLHAVVYISQQDPESQQQLQVFGQHAASLETVDCAARPDYCQEKQIEEVPTIVIYDLGLDMVGLQSITDLENLFKQL